MAMTGEVKIFAGRVGRLYAEKGDQDLVYKKPPRPKD